MGRKSTTNQWSKGMIKDLNPINVPNDSLTDCLNGTIITYNGNEFSLQNDMGNYPLSNCKLKEGFIPIGLKEYGGILYIVSHNPITNETEIGSYPSTKTETHKECGENPKEIETIDLKGNYTDLIKEIKTISFYPFEEAYIVNPNDEYSLDFDTTNGEYQEFKYYTLDSDKNLYDITDKVKTNAEAGNTLRKVSWQIPGWFVVRNRIAELSSFFISIPELNSDIFVTTDDKGESHGKVSGKIKFTIQTYDSLFTNVDYDTIKKDLKIKYSIYLGDEFQKEEVISLNDDGEFTLYNKAKSYIASNVAFEFDECTPNSKIKIVAVPILKEMYYDNMEQTYSFVLKNMNNVNSIDIGSQTWKYSTNSETNTLTLYFDTIGVSSISQKDNLELYYTIDGYNSKTSKFEPVKSGYTSDTTEESLELPYEKTYCTSWNKDGFDTSISLPMVPYVHVLLNDKYIDEGNYLFPENIYRIKFDICEKIPDDKTEDYDKYVKKSIYKVIIASEIMNDFEYARYDEIPFDTWFNKYKDYVKNKTIKLESYDVAEEGDVVLDENPAYTAWKNGGEITNYKTFIDSDVVGDLGKEISLHWSIPYMLSVHCDSDVNMLNGPLWNSILENATLSDNFDSTLKLYFDKYTGFLQKTDGSSIYTRSTKAEYSKEISYTPNILRSLEMCNYTVKTITSEKLDIVCDISDSVYNHSSYTAVTFGATSAEDDNATIEQRIKSPKGSQNIYKDYARTDNDLNKFIFNKFQKFDILKGDIEIVNFGGTDENGRAMTWMYSGNFNGNSEIQTKKVTHVYYANLDKTIKLYCIVLKGSGEAPFYIIYSATNTCWTDTTDENAESDRNTFFDKLLQNIIKVTYSNHIVYGSFVKLDSGKLKSEQITNNLTISGTIDLNDVKYSYNGFNLINKTDRDNFISELTNKGQISDLNTYNLDHINSIATLPDSIALDSVEVSVNANLVNKTKLDESINEIKAEIETTNSKVDTEYKQCIADSYQTTEYAGDSHYYDKSTTTVDPTQKYILNILNYNSDNSFWSSEKLLFGAACGFKVDSGYYKDRLMGIYIGETNDDWNHFKLKV